MPCARPRIRDSIVVFRYFIRMPNGDTLSADTPEEFDALLDRALAEFPDAELAGDAELLTELPGAHPETLKSRLGDSKK